MYQLSREFEQRSLVFRGPRVTWFRPTSLADFLALKKQFPHARIVIGNTEIGKLGFSLELFKVHSNIDLHIS